MICRKKRCIAADIAYTVIGYFRVTGDIEFIKSAVLEMLAEYKKFWVSTAEINYKT